MPPRKPPTVVPLASLSDLRPERDVQPGAPDKTKPRRSSVEVAAEKAAKELAKKNKAAAQSAGVLAISTKENEMAMEDIETDLSADHPPANAMKKALRSLNLMEAAKKMAMGPGTGQCTLQPLSRSRLTARI